MPLARVEGTIAAEGAAAHGQRFLSYDHEDAGRAAPLAAALEAHGHSVWWDRHIHGGAEYNSAIEDAVEHSDAVIVLWSANSVRSAWVRDEAAEGRDAGKLVPVLIDAVKPPMGFRQYQTIDLTAWTGGKRIVRLPDLLNAIDKVAKIAPAAVAATAPVVPAVRESKIAAANRGVSRRIMLGGGAAATAALAAGGVWWASRERVDPRYQALIDQARRRFAIKPATSRPCTLSNRQSPFGRAARNLWACSRWSRVCWRKILRQPARQL